MQAIAWNKAGWQMVVMLEDERTFYDVITLKQLYVRHAMNFPSEIKFVQQNREK